MTADTRTRREGKPQRSRADLDQEITDRILETLERGDIPPWRQPWTTAGILPTSATTGRPYRGINPLLLALTAQQRGYASPYWVTFKQARSFGGTVRRGERGTVVVFFKRYDVKDETAEDGTRSVRVMRAYTVFNVEQCDDLRLPPRFQPADREPVEILPAVQEIMDGYAGGPAIRHNGEGRAYYDADADSVTLPELTSFNTPAGFAETVLHEMTHSTGHAKRLDRLERTAYGTATYAREELVAEIGATMLAGHAGIALDYSQAAAYVGSWLGPLQDDRRLIVTAALAAQRAVDHVLGTAFEDA